jgi:hypothetical protein
LVESHQGVNISTEASGIHREYLKALSANAAAKKEHDDAARELNQELEDQAPPERAASDYLYEHLLRIRLQRKTDRLQAVSKYLTILGQKPAASSEFLSPEEIFRDSLALPSVPSEVVDGLAQREASTESNLKDVRDQLDKQVLRTKLVLKAEENLLLEIKETAVIKPGSVGERAKLAAINTARTELINWIEGELGKAGDGSNDEEEDGVGDDFASSDGDKLDSRLKSIQAKYQQYLAGRKALVLLAEQRPLPSLTPQTSSDTQEPAAGTTSSSATHLLSPYIDGLLCVGHEQRGLIGQKSHVNILVAKQLKESCQTLDHLAEESHLLPQHPIPGTTRRKAGLNDGLSASESLDMADRIKPWVFAADSAKIATLESVAEKIEEGQVALESSMAALGEIDGLLGRISTVETQDRDASEADIWLSEGDSKSGRGATRKHTEAKPDKLNSEGDLWSTLDGNLGLLRSDKELP